MNLEMNNLDYLYMLVSYEEDKGWYPVNVFDTWDAACGECHDLNGDAHDELELYRVRCYKKDEDGPIYVTIVNNRPDELFYDESTMLDYVKYYQPSASVARYSPI